MADKELEQSLDGASQEFDDDQIAGEVAEPEDEQVAEDAELEPVEGSDEPATVSFDDLRKLQSKYDKQIAELRKENETLKAEQKTVPDGPTPEEQRRYNDLISRYEQLMEAADKERDPGKIRGIERQIGSLQSSLMEAESVMIARQVGIDPNDPEYRNLIMTDPEISSGKDIERIAWQVKAQAKPSSTQLETLKERENNLAKAEADFEKRIATMEKKLRASIMADLGLTATPASQPAGATGQRAQLERQLAEYKQSGNMLGALEVKRKLLAFPQ